MLCVRTSSETKYSVLQLLLLLLLSCFSRVQLFATLWLHNPPGSSLHEDSPGKNTGVGCHFLLQGIFPTQESNLHLPCLLHGQVDSLPLCHLESPNGCLVTLNSALEKWKVACNTPFKGRKLLTQHTGSPGNGEGNCPKWHTLPISRLSPHRSQAHSPCCRWRMRKDSFSNTVVMLRTRFRTTSILDRNYFSDSEAITCSLMCHAIMAMWLPE